MTQDEDVAAQRLEIALSGGWQDYKIQGWHGTHEVRRGTHCDVRFVHSKTGGKRAEVRLSLSKSWAGTKFLAERRVIYLRSSKWFFPGLEDASEAAKQGRTKPY